MHSALADLDLDRITIVYPDNDAYPPAERVRVAGLGRLAREAAGDAGGPDPASFRFDG